MSKLDELENMLKSLQKSNKKSNKKSRHTHEWKGYKVDSSNLEEHDDGNTTEFGGHVTVHHPDGSKKHFDAHGTDRGHNVRNEAMDHVNTHSGGKMSESDHNHGVENMFGQHYPTKGTLNKTGMTMNKLDELEKALRKYQELLKNAQMGYAGQPGGMTQPSEATLKAEKLDDGKEDKKDEKDEKKDGDSAMDKAEDKLQEKENKALTNNANKKGLYNTNWRKDTKTHDRKHKSGESQKGQRGQGTITTGTFIKSSERSIIYDNNGQWQILEKARKETDKLAIREDLVAGSSPVGEDKKSSKWRKPKSGEKGIKLNEKDTKNTKSFAGDQAAPKSGKAHIPTSGSSPLSVEGGKYAKDPIQPEKAPGRKKYNLTKSSEVIHHNNNSQWSLEKSIPASSTTLTDKQLAPKPTGKQPPKGSEHGKVTHSKPKYTFKDTDDHASGKSGVGRHSYEVSHNGKGIGNISLIHDGDGNGSNLNEKHSRDLVESAAIAHHKSKKRPYEE